jgi:hypothetical protein
MIVMPHENIPPLLNLQDQKAAQALLPQSLGLLLPEVLATDHLQNLILPSF